MEALGFRLVLARPRLLFAGRVCHIPVAVRSNRHSDWTRKAETGAGPTVANRVPTAGAARDMWKTRTPGLFSGVLGVAGRAWIPPGGGQIAVWPRKLLQIRYVTDLKLKLFVCDQQRDVHVGRDRESARWVEFDLIDLRIAVDRGFQPQKQVVDRR